MEWSMVSNAADKSSSERIDTFPWSEARYRSFTTRIRAVSVLCDLRLERVLDNILCFRNPTLTDTSQGIFNVHS
ncbi:hypothetical protein ACOMHN_061176 [Nucella lapillus]